jgi:hypothetical protein
MAKMAIMQAAMRSRGIRTIRSRAMADSTMPIEIVTIATKIPKRSHP